MSITGNLRLGTYSRNWTPYRKLTAMTNNPYAAPTAPANGCPQTPNDLERAKVEKIIPLHRYAVTSFAACFAMLCVNGIVASEPVSALLAIPMLIGGVVLWGSTICLAFRLNGIFGAIILLLFMLVPLLNLFLFAMLLNDAGKRIKAQGYKVGFLGGIKEHNFAQAAPMHPA